MSTNSTMLKTARQGVRQTVIIRDSSKVLLLPGDTFVDFEYPDGVCVDATTLYTHVIQPGTLGIIHEHKRDSTGCYKVSVLSIIRDDCKAARRALRANQA